MARKPKTRLSQLAIADKPHHWQTEYFSDQDIVNIVKEARVPLTGTVIITRFGCEEEISRHDLLKEDLNAFASYWRGMLEIQRTPREIEAGDQGIDPQNPDRHGPGRKKKPISAKGADRLFDYLILTLGEFWTDPRIFNRKNVGTSSSSLNGEATGPFVRFALACCKVFGIDKTSNAIRAAVQKEPKIFRRLSQKSRTRRRNLQNKAFKDLGF